MINKRYPLVFTLVLGSAICGMGVFISSIAITLFGLLMLVTGISIYKDSGDSPGWDIWIDYLFPIILGLAFFIDGLRLADWPSARGLGIAMILFPLANTVRMRVLRIQGYFAEQVTFVIVVIIGVGPGNWLVNLVLGSV